MKNQKTSIWERIRMAYRALTQDYYVFFGIDKDAIIWNDDDTYKHLDKKKMSQFSYISYDEKIEAYGEETNLHNFLWHVIEEFAKEAQVKESAEIQHVNDMRKENDNSLTQELVSEELEKENKIEILADIIFNAAKHGYMPYDTQDEYCAMEIAKKNIDKFIVPKKQEESVSEELEEAAEEWDESLYRSDAFKAGAKWQKEKEIQSAIEAVVSQVPCSNEIILYNPSSVDKYYLPQEMNKLGLNKGDKVKLVIIKED